MSHVTQCPACRTHFRVVADQLKISDGWVRCGQCGEVFDAKVSMQPWPLAPVTEAAPAVPETPDPGWVPDTPLEWAPEPTPVSAPEVPDLPVEPVLEPSAQSADSEPEPEPEPAPAPAPALEPEPEPAPEPEVAFVRDAKRRAVWQRPWVKVLLGLAVLCLGLLLLAQVLVHQRHRLAAAYPGVAPVLQALCEPLGCAIEPYPQIESVLIDSSALVREREDLYRLEVGLKNTSGLVLAVPALELSLTNTADEVVLRRVLLPNEWDTPPEALAPHATAALTVHLSLSAASELRMAGYRALVFYP